MRGIYRGLTGWYDGRGTGLNPLLPREFCAREMVHLAGGADKLLARAIDLQREGQHQLACELCDVVIEANPQDRVARVVKANSLDYLGYQSGNLNMFGILSLGSSTGAASRWHQARRQRGFQCPRGRE